VAPAPVDPGPVRAAGNYLELDQRVAPVAVHEGADHRALGTERDQRRVGGTAVRPSVAT
jgi:hypothetical protein